MTNFKKVSIAGDGNCLFRAVSLYLFNTQENYEEIRCECVKYINKKWDSFKDFLIDLKMDKNSYCNLMQKNGTFGTSCECLSMSDLYKLNFKIYFQISNLDKNGLGVCKDPPMILSSKENPNSISLLFSGNPNSGHFDLLIENPTEFETIYNRCNICFKNFKNNNGLKIHVAKIHQMSQSLNNFKSMDNAKIGKSMECLSCNKKFNTKRGLNMHKYSKHKDTEDIFDEIFFVIYFSKLESTVPIIKRIPKGSRACVAEELTFLLQKCISANDISSWICLFLFPYAVLRIPFKSKNKTSLTASVKENIIIWKKNKILGLNDLIAKYKVEKTNKSNLKFKQIEPGKVIAKKIESKISEGDIKGAIRILSSGARSD